MTTKLHRSTERGTIPLYARIEALIRNKILSGAYKPGELLPKEDDLLNQYGVSKITIRSALSKLKEDNLIIKIPGKGTFVAEDIPIKKQFVISGTVYDIICDRKRYEVVPISIKKEKVCNTRNPNDISEFLHLSMEDEITVMKRVRLLNNSAIFFVENYIPTEIAQHVSLKELNDNMLLEILSKKINLKVERGEMFIEAMPAESDVAEILDCYLFEPIMALKTYYWMNNNKPFELVNVFMKAEYFKYKVEVKGHSFHDNTQRAEQKE